MYVARNKWIRPYLRYLLSLAAAVGFVLTLLVSSNLPLETGTAHAAALQDVARTLYVPHVVVDSRYDTDILLTNAAVDSQTVRLVLHSTDRRDAALHLEGLSQRIVSVREAFDIADGQSLEGWMAIESDSAELAGLYALVDTLSGRSKHRLMKLSGSLSRSLIFAGMSRSRHVHSRIGLVNPHPFEVQLSVDWFDRSGHLLQSENRIVEPYGLHFEDTDQIWNGTDTFVGHVEVSSSDGLTAFQTFQMGNREAALQMQSQHHAGSILYFPMLLEMSSDSYAGLAIANSDDHSVEVLFSAFDMQGQPIDVRPGADVRLIDGRGTWTGLVSEIFQLDDQADLRGYIKAEVGDGRPSLTGVALFGNSSLTRLTGITAALQPARSYLFSQQASSAEPPGRIPRRRVGT